MPLIECLLCGEFLSNYDGKGNMAEVENGMMRAEDHLREEHNVTKNMTFFRNIHFLPEEERSKMLLKSVILDHGSLETRLNSPRDNEFNGPFPDPLTLMSNGRSFDQHTQYTHKDETQCTRRCQLWDTVMNRNPENIISPVLSRVNIKSKISTSSTVPGLSDHA